MHISWIHPKIVILLDLSIILTYRSHTFPIQVDGAVLVPRDVSKIAVELTDLYLDFDYKYKLETVVSSVIPGLD